ncbi:hypothetical protein [Mycobacteroides abscessus]|uniref:hypothetical protein n=1 Tax=Mycobacteroides abscessus TaxID=36809 RepID=UPI001F467A72|nr:hypothetical protein [Mycobacteroides abscessus]MDO3352102.1 hypothetical protein [Mycobacteroides abscessus subsp. abscessus]
MINRPRRSPRSRSVTSLGVRGLLASGFTLATLTAATLNTAVASADPVVRCRTLEGGGTYTCITETPTPTTGTTGTSSGSGIGDWFSEHVGTVMFVIAVAAVIAIVAAVKSGTSKDKAAASEADLARGRAIAQSAHAAAVRRAHAEAAAQVPPREVWDPHGVGLAPPPMPAPKISAAPATTPEDLQRYATFGWAVPWIPGTAFAAAVSRSGDISRIEQVWVDACRLAGLGDTDEQGAFIPAATVVRVNGIEGSGDAWVAVDTRDYTVGAKQLDSVRDHLLRTARVESASPFQRDAARDWFITVLSMDAPAPPQATAPAAEEVQGPRVDPRWA